MARQNTPMSIQMAHIIKFPNEKQSRLDELLDKNAEGTISDKELTELQLLVVEAEQLITANSKRVAETARDA
jgi:hypothetical protein